MRKDDQNGTTTVAIVPVTATIPVDLVPTPTQEYRTYRKTQKVTVGAGTPTLPLPIPKPIPMGARVLMWKQDPTVSEIGIRKAFLPRPVQSGPKDGRLQVAG